MMNRKCIVLLCAALLGAGWAQAQVSEPLSHRGWSLAPRVGVNLATRNPQDAWLAGFHGELLAQMRFNRVWALEFGLGYSREGCRRGYDHSYYDVKRDVVNLPIMAKAYVWKGLYFDAGGYFGYECNLANPCAGMTLGVGYEMVERLFVAFNYNYGVVRFGSLDGGSGSLANQVCQFSLGWRFGLSKSNRW